MNYLVLHPATRSQLEHFTAQPSHALLLVGPQGIGKSALALALCAQLLAVDAEQLVRHPYATMLAPDERGTLSIDAVRELQRFLQLRTTGAGALRRTVIVEHADALTPEAQNALLKLLEEPPADTLLVLTTANLRSLLPTIRSRVQAVTVHQPYEADLTTFFAANGATADAVTQAYLLSGGVPGLMHALLYGDNEHPLVAAVAQAKELLRQTTFERLCAVDVAAKQKDTARTLLAALQRITQTGLSQATAREDAARLKQWHGIRKAVAAADDALQKNANPKLTLTNLCLRM
jgi:DNA polymerase-3 subunit delta'